MSIATSDSRSPARSMQAIIAKVDGGYTVTTVLSIDGQVRVLSEKAAGRAFGRAPTTRGEIAGLFCEGGEGHREHAFTYPKTLGSVPQRLERPSQGT